MHTILIVDDEKNYLTIMHAILEDQGFEAIKAGNGFAALKELDQSDIDLVVTDMKMPEMDGIRLLEHIKARHPNLPVIVITAHGTIEKAVEAMQKGAYTYILKPFDNDTFIQHIRNAIAIARVYDENRRLREAITDKYKLGNIIGKSSSMERVFETILKVAPSSATVLIDGESGTGKELAAKSIHYNSPRKDQPFIAVNCSAFAESLLENELFGHEKGAFTGAHALHKGRFEIADGGTLFLDEIGDISQSLQVKLLRVLQEKTIERIGGTKSIHVDFRLIAATNRNLKEEVLKGSFREDLYYRLNVVKITLPPLRERKEDIPLLTDHFIRKYENQRNASEKVEGMQPEARKMLLRYDWPGNVRELENAIERAVVLCTGNHITPSDLPAELHEQANPLLAAFPEIPADAGLSDTLAWVEKTMILQALKESKQIQAHAARRLGIGKSGLNQKLKKYNIRNPQ